LGLRKRCMPARVIILLLKRRGKVEKGSNQGAVSSDKFHNQGSVKGEGGGLEELFSNRERA